MSNIAVAQLLQILSATPEIDSSLEQQQIICLADNIYFEARNQSVAGMIAVGHVTMNRVNDNRFPNDICSVVKEGPVYTNWKGTVLPVKHRCQFSWYCDGKSDEIANMETYKKVLDISIEIYYNKIYDFTEGSTHYHADYVTPSWASSKTKTTEIDDHKFYRWEK